MITSNSNNNNIQFTIYLLFFFSLFASQSCRETIDLLPKKDQLEGISIQAKLVKGNPSVANVIVERVFTFSGESRKPLPIVAVSIFDETGQEFFLSKNNSVSDFIGFIYDEPTAFPVQHFKKYACRVVLLNGAIYESAFETLLPVPPIESLEFEIIEKNIKNLIEDYVPAKFARFRVNTPLTLEENGNKTNLRWIILRSFKASSDCIVTDAANFSHISVINGKAIAGDFLKKFNFYDEFISLPFGDTYILSVFQESLTDEAYKYWAELENLTQREGTQFEATPGVIRSNFKNINAPSEEVYGYFYATSNNIHRIRVCPDDLGFRPGILNDMDNCSDSLIPDFWVDCD